MLAYDTKLSDLRLALPGRSRDREIKISERSRSQRDGQRNSGAASVDTVLDEVAKGSVHPDIVERGVPTAARLTLGSVEHDCDEPRDTSLNDLRNNLEASANADVKRKPELQRVLVMQLALLECDERCLAGDIANPERVILIGPKTEEWVHVWEAVSRTRQSTIGASSVSFVDSARDGTYRKAETRDDGGNHELLHSRDKFGLAVVIVGNDNEEAKETVRKAADTLALGGTLMLLSFTHYIHPEASTFLEGLGLFPVTPLQGRLIAETLPDELRGVTENALRGAAVVVTRKLSLQDGSLNSNGELLIGKPGLSSTAIVLRDTLKSLEEATTPSEKIEHAKAFLSLLQELTYRDLLNDRGISILCKHYMASLLVPKAVNGNGNEAQVKNETWSVVESLANEIRGGRYSYEATDLLLTSVLDIFTLVEEGELHAPLDDTGGVLRELLIDDSDLAQGLREGLCANNAFDEESRDTLRRMRDELVIRQLIGKEIEVISSEAELRNLLRDFQSAVSRFLDQHSALKATPETPKPLMEER